MRSKSPQRGFTLVEIIVTLAVVAVIAGIGIAALRTTSRSSNSAALAQGKELLLSVRDQAVASLECRRIAQETPGNANLALNVFRDVDCNPATTAGDVLLQTVRFDSTVTQVKIEDGGQFDDDQIEYQANGSLFDTAETRLVVVDAAGMHRIKLQLSTGGVHIDDDDD